MRRFLVIGGCLVGLGWLVWLSWRSSVVGDEVFDVEGDGVAIPEPAVGGGEEVEPGSFFEVTAVDHLSSDEPDGSMQVLVSESMADPGEARVDVEEVAPESYRRSELSLVVDGDQEKLLGALAEIRRDVLRRVGRRPLHVLAEERGAPHLRRLFMTNGMLLDAILDAEGVPPAHVPPSPETLGRVRALALEMFQRSGEYLEPEAVGILQPEPGRESVSAVTAVDGRDRPSTQGQVVSLEEARGAPHVVAPESYRRSQQLTGHDDGEQRLVELAQLRHEALATVQRPPLFAMAKERGVPHFRLLFMTNQGLLEAILEAEHVPPADVLPSDETLDRVRALILEMFRRNDEYLATPWGQASS